MFFPFDPMYFVFVMPALLLAMWAQNRVQGTFQEFSRHRSERGWTGAQVARAILDDAGLQDVRIEPIAGQLSDHYDPRDRVLRLSEPVHGSNSLAAIGVAAHETGHALQHAHGYLWLGLRMAIIPVTQFSSRAALPLFFIGLFFAGPSLAGLLMDVAILLFLSAVAFQLITLPVEYNASSQALAILEGGGYLTRDEMPGARRVLNAAALTYVAAALMAVMQLLYLLLMRDRR